MTELPEPEIVHDNDVVVHLRAAGINPVDYKLRANGTIRGSLPAILGWDGAGVVESIGPSVRRVRPGDEVYFCDGGFGPTPGTDVYKRQLQCIGQCIRNLLQRFVVASLG